MKKMKCPARWAKRLATLCLMSGLSLSLSVFAEGVNLQGVWKISAPRTSFEPEGGASAIRFTELGKQVYEENKRLLAAGKDKEFDYTKSRCSSPGVPRVMLTPQRFQIFQRTDLIMIAFEWNRVWRSIPLPGMWPQDDRMALENARLVGNPMGTAKGRWEGATLVVTTELFSDDTLIDELVPHGYDMKVVERIRLRNANTLEVRTTIEDPEYFVQPWSTVVTYKRQPDAIFPDDVCLDRLMGPPPLATKP